MKDHLVEKEEGITLVRDLRAIMRPKKDGGLGLGYREVARAVGLAEDGTGVRAWVGVWTGTKWISGRTVPTGDRKKALARFVKRMMRRMEVNSPA